MFRNPVAAVTVPLNPLLLISAVVAGLVGFPVASVLANIFSSGTAEIWGHLGATVLPEYAANTLWLCLGVALGVVVVGVATAWLVVMHDFPGRRLFEWALILPMAMPAYVLAYAYTDLLQFSGPVQTMLRDQFDWQRGDYWFPEIRSLGGAVLMFVCVLYPYVYLLARTAFLERAGGMLEVARSLGLGAWQSFFRVSLPLARPAIVAGGILALMETLADYGTVSYFAVQTFTTGIYRAWFSLGDRVAAAQLAAMLLGVVVLLLAMERISQGRARFHNTTGRQGGLSGVRQRLRLHGGRAVWSWLVCALPLFFGFLLPGSLLLRLALLDGDAQFGLRFVELSRNSFLLAGLTAVLAVVLALLLAYAARLSRGWVVTALNRLVGLGYAVPGSVIAVGVLIPVTRLDHWLAGQWQMMGWDDPGLILTGGITALVYAYLVRVLAVAMQTVEASMAKVTPNMDAAARSLGLGQVAALWRVHLPILRGSLLTAGLLVFVDVMKELPATLVMRPFNFDTLATQTYTLAADERLAEASTAALAIIGVGLLPLILLSRQITASQNRRSG
ncbi:MAG: iron ABC transporter permease [Sterolibacterium sp.]|nr:iron ABC transporter permease [Sterolibacterium sp.]MBP9798844.1 iron ABC transporter permease [Sterolibacterium sp.]